MSMTDLVIISTLSIGDSVIIGTFGHNYDVCSYDSRSRTDEINATLIYNNDINDDIIIIGLPKPIGSIGWEINPRSSNALAGIKYGCKYAWHIPDILVRIEKQVISPKQICSICRLPAPHHLEQSNYICTVCKVLGEL